MGTAKEGRRLGPLEARQAFKIEVDGEPVPAFAGETVATVLLALGRIDEFIATHLTRRPPLIDVESTLHARVNRAFSSAKAEKELGYRPGQARVALEQRRPRTTDA